MRQRLGFTLVEQLLILTLLATLSAFAFHSVAGLLDGLAVRAAARETRDVFSAAREHAVSSGVRTAVDIDPAAGSLVAHAATDTVLMRSVAQLFSVALQSTRDSMAYAPSGLGYGASNLSIVLRRRSAVETVSVSRLGRVR